MSASSPTGGAASIRFAVVCPAFSCAPWVVRSLHSIQQQSHRNFRCVLIDDLSPDKSFDLARAAIAGDPRFTVLRNEVRQYPLANIVRGTKLAAENPDDVVVIVDADDWLKHDRVLERIAGIYSDPSVWLTYGSCELVRRPLRARLLRRTVRGRAAPYPDIVRQRNLYRYQPGYFLATHLRTYRRFLWDGLRDEDLRDEDGVYYKAAGDAVTMWPLLEMATDRHIRYVSDILYVYNNNHPLSENLQSASWTDSDQFRINVTVRAKPPYAPLHRG